MSSLPTLRAAAVVGVLLAVILPLPAVRAEDGAPAAAPAPASAPAAAAEPAPAEPEELKPPLDFLDEGLIERDDGTVVYFYRTNFVTPKELLGSLTSLLKVPGVTMKEFPRQNVLLIEGEPESVDLALEAAAYFDVATPQVFIEAKVIEITYDSNFEFGLDYLSSRAQVGPNTLFQGAEAILNPTSYIQSTLPGGLPFQGTSLLFGFAGTKAEEFGLLDVTIQALQMDGKAEVLSKPSIICTQGKPANVTTKEDRFIVQFLNADRSNERYGSSTLTTGVTLTVTATHIGESFVTMDINPIVQGVQGVATSGSATLRPITTTRSAQTTVTMADGETLVIGGLYTNACVVSKAKTPLISDIPVLGQLFTRTQESKAKTELVFLLTPTIVRKSTADLKVITPPAELDRLEEKDDDCWRPAGPSLACPEECKPPPPPEPTERVAYPCDPRPVPPPVTSSPSIVPRSAHLPPPPTARR